MATDASFIEYVAEQADLGPALTWKRMFGEYALYLDGKVIAFVCDNRVYMKPTDAARTVLGTVHEAPAYPGSRMYFRLGDELDDRPLLQRLFLATARELPLPKPKAPPRPRAKKTTARKTKAP